MMNQEKMLDLLQWIYETVRDFAGSSTYDIPYEWVKEGYKIDLADKDVQSNIREALCSYKYMDLIQAVDFDDLHRKVYVMIWESNNKKKYTIDQYEEFCKDALQAPPIEQFEDGSIDEVKWFKENTIHITVGNHDIELDYNADNVNEIKYALREMYEAEYDGPPTTGNTVGSEYRPAELKDIIRVAIQNDWEEWGWNMGGFGEFIREFIKCYDDTSNIFCVYDIIYRNIKDYTDRFKCNFGKLDMYSMKSLDRPTITRIIKGLICTEKEFLYGKTDDGKDSDITFLMDYTLKPTGELIGWFYGEPNEEYIADLINDYKMKLFK